MIRPTLRELFVSAPKKLEVSFYTSSIEKFLQARLVLGPYGLELGHYLSSQEAYHEDYDLGQEQLLVRAIDEIKHRLGVNSLFFVEDTTVRINALSSADRDFPGLKIKEWFSETSFEEFDEELRRKGNDRSATVSSDIALHLPGLKRPVFVHGETNGRVAETSPSFMRSDQYPWLSPDTFNGWFIPDGEDRCLGEMSFEDSLDHDFRVRALVALVDRLEEYAAVLNLPGHSYSIKRPRADAVNLNLFKEVISLHVVIGKVCAGKTTLGQYASSRCQYHFIEASNVVCMIAEEHKIDAPTPFYKAKVLLDTKGPDIVARSIVGMYGDDLKTGAVITGFRTIEEIQFIRREFPDCKVVFVDATERTRFERHLRRGRLEDITTLDQFRQQDRQQGAFGLLPVAHDLADVKIENESVIKDYHAQIEALVDGQYEATAGVSKVRRDGTALKETRLFRCLRALEGFHGPATCPEIADLTNRDVPTNNPEHAECISPRHVNWVLKGVPELARRVDAKGDRVRYEILPAGQAYLDAVRSMEE